MFNTNSSTTSMITNAHVRATLLAFVWLLMANMATSNEILVGGDFDDLEVGSAPDNNQPSGAWFMDSIPAHPQDIEDDSSQFSIVGSNTFDPNATGNSMRIESPRSHTNTFITNVFDERIQQAEDEIIRVNFDAFVADLGTARQGGFGVFLGEGSSRAGSGNRGPQFAWDSRGRIVVRDQGSRAVVNETPLDTWQHVQIDIDLMDDTYDLFYSANDDSPQLVEPNLSFRAGGKRSYLDRLTVTLFEGMPSRPEGVAYLDNINIEVLQKTPGDANLDGVVDFPDFLALSEHFGEGSRRDPRAWSQGDFDGNGEVDFPDFLILSENFGGVAAAATSAASVPEPTGLSIALFGLLGLIGFRKRR